MGSSKRTSPLKLTSNHFAVPLVDKNTTEQCMENSGSNFVTCKHLPAVASFLRMYYLVSRHIHWSDTPFYCSECDGVNSPMLICLQCMTFGCWTVENHWNSHNKVSGHALSIERSSGVIYCTICKCWVWNDLMDVAWEQSKISPENSCELICKFERGIVESIDENSTKLVLVCPSVRGLYNLGNTCFMNSVVQVLLQTRQLRDFFLAPKRTHVNCIFSNCIVCELDTLFCQMNDGLDSPIAPNRLLSALWNNSRDMAGYDQQDAHELFITIRDCLHTNLKDSVSFNCKCVIHRLFSGVLQSDIICSGCNHVAETLDPFLDISLDLPIRCTPVNLDTCLSRFTQVEQLATSNFICNGCCKSGFKVEKCLTIRNAPAILAIHLKRFDGANKIDTPVHFGNYLDLSRYMIKTLQNNDGDSEADDSNAKKLYKLYGVVCHMGTMESGHYIAFVKCKEEWFCIDDAHVSICDEATVFACNAYMIFYAEHKNN